MPSTRKRFYCILFLFGLLCVTVYVIQRTTRSRVPEDTSYPVDLVVLWVDGNDPKHQHQRKMHSMEDWEPKRYSDHDELRYCLRSAFVHAPWIRYIHVVTDDCQHPTWLDTSLDSRVRHVTHSQILPHDCLPTFNAVTIELGLQNIPGLSEHFLYANDDMFFGASVLPSYFFRDRKALHRMLGINGINTSVLTRINMFVDRKDPLRMSIVNVNGQLLDTVHVKTKSRMYRDHNITPMTISDLVATRAQFTQEWDTSYQFKFRSPLSISPLDLMIAFCIDTKRSHQVLVTPLSHPVASLTNVPLVTRICYAYIQVRRPTLFCINDFSTPTVELSTDITAFMKSTFPLRAPWELTGPVSHTTV